MATLTLTKFTANGPVSGDMLATSNRAAIESAAMMAIRNTPALLEEAHGWIIDAYSLESFTTSPRAITSMVNISYDGGCAEFYRNSLALAPILTRVAA